MSDTLEIIELNDEIVEKDKEIETHITLNKQLLEDIDKAGKEIERLNNIIKEVRKYIETLEKQHAYKFVKVDNHIEMRIDENEYLVWCKYNKLLKILEGDDDLLIK